MRIGLLLMICLWGALSLSAQLSNAEVYRSLWKKHLTEQTHYSKISGQILTDLLPAYEPDTASSLRLQILNPQVNYTQLPDKSIIRSIEIPYNVKDSLIESFRLRYVDTLQRENFKQIHRESREALRGESPTFAARWLRPVGILSLSVGGILALFYVRSS
ncbi:MAG: hypothetical protein AB8H47_24970 [Bacteroidia bacterium]